MSRTVAHECSHCGTVERVPLALGYPCPTCAAPVGKPCIDQRSAHRQMSRLHASREELVMIGADRAREAVVRTLRVVS